MARIRKKQTAEASGDLAQQIVAALRAPATTGTPMVGIRNISFETIGLPASPVPNEPSVTLHANFGDHDPHSVAIISLPWWLQLRRSNIYGMGMIVRDDSLLGDHHQRAPEDRPEDCATGHAVNAIMDVQAFIENSTEQELRERVAKITSAATIRKLQVTIDRRVAEEQDKYPETDADRAAKAVKGMPAIYAKLESLLEDRLYEIRPPIDI